MLGVADTLAQSEPPSFLASRVFSIKSARLRVVLLAAAYFGAFAWMYVVYVSERYEYFGFGYQSDWRIYDMLTVGVLCLFPSFWLPTKIDRPSALFLYFQYLLIYIPAIWMTRHAVNPVLEAGDQFLVSITLAVSMSILLWAHHRLPLVRINTIRVRVQVFWGGLYIFAAVLLAALILQLGGNFHLVGLGDIYSLRQDATDSIEASGNLFVNYAFTWVNGLLLPLIFARAAIRSSYMEMLCVTGCYIFLFGIGGAKTSLFSPVILIATRFWASRGASRMPLLMISGFIAALLVPLCLPFEEGIGALVKVWWIGIVDMRTFSIPGLSIPQYFDFFSNHPLTYGSHITGLNWFINYPYDLDIPRTVGYYYYGHEVTANASFWAQDGMASFGVIGVVLVTLIASLVMWLLDSVTQGLRIDFVTTALVGIIISFMNVSLFTTLVTGGLGLFLVAAVFIPREESLRFMLRRETSV